MGGKGGVCQRYVRVREGYRDVGPCTVRKVRRNVITGGKKEGWDRGGKR